MLLCILGFFIGFCVFLVSLANDLKSNMNLIKKKTKSRIDRAKSSNIEIEIKGNLCEFVRFNSDAAQLSGNKNIFFFNFLYMRRVEF